MDIDAVTREVADLHVEFERWFAGTSASLDRVERSLAPAFTFVGTGGSVLGRDDVLGFLRSARERGPLAIDVEDVRVAWRRDRLVGATYVEVQTADGEATHRRASCVLEADDRAPGGLSWLSVHETWIDPPPTD